MKTKHLIWLAIALLIYFVSCQKLLTKLAHLKERCQPEEQHSEAEQQKSGH